MRRAIVLLILTLAACGTDPPAPLPPPDMTGCNGVANHFPVRGMQHVPEPMPITYEDNPPASGNHRFEWAKWGEYAALPPERWVHNLEHGGAVFLYGGTATSTTVGALRAYAQTRPDDDGGKFRWILTSFMTLPTEIAVITWTWTYEANAVCPTEIDAFLALHYRTAPEDIPNDGPFEEGWIAR